MGFTHRAAAAAIGTAVLALVAGCTTASSSSGPSGSGSAASPSVPAANTKNAATGATSAVAQPDDQGKTLIAEIDSATTAVDVVIYQIGDPGIEAALTRALTRGAVVRVMMDGSSASQVSRNTPFATRMRAAAAAAGLPATAFQAHWSSNNMNITHQKSVIVDAVNATGDPFGPDSMPASASLLISTGNFLDTSYAPHYWDSRDYYVVVHDPSLVVSAEKVFSSDFGCAGRTVTNGLKDATDLVWSNGSTGFWTTDAADEYPSAAEGYSNQSLTYNKDQTDQGNAGATLLALLAGAQKGDVVRISAEEMSADHSLAGRIVTAVEAAATRGADVRLVMTYGNAQNDTLSAIAKAGATVTVYAPQAVVPEALYIHAKILTVTKPDGSTQAFVGSENISTGSLTWNRELGIVLGDDDAAAIDAVTSTFDRDFASTTNTVQLTAAAPAGFPPAWGGGKSAAPKASASPTAAAASVGTVGGAAGLCGPVATG